jgi:hypothetical protein
MALVRHSNSMFRFGSRNFLFDALSSKQLPQQVSCRGTLPSKNVKKKPIHWQKNFGSVGEFEASSEMRSL